PPPSLPNLTPPPPSTPAPNLISDGDLRKKNGPLLIIGVAALALLGIVGYFAFSGKKEAPSPVATAEEADGASPDDFGAPPPADNTPPRAAIMGDTAPTDVEESAGTMAQNPENAPPPVDGSLGAPAETKAAPPPPPVIRSGGMMLTKEESVDILLDRAKDDLRASRFTAPPGNNALEKYRRILRIEPNNKHARKGIERVADEYLALAKQAIKEDNFRKAESYIKKAEEVIPHYPAAQKWREKKKAYEAKYRERQSRR
ncbi:MAG: hypothetical protein HQK87_09115, partial [Nitrospinae bacterium]|nr:hypothetical protein [Nitrospinota bacterium]